ncbi:MAG: aerobic carbon-monoxide dehydrogenase large subunit [Gaiellales bacterium]|nr:aerobic carbon-monoxide dehydrogenase large subunit [Gaiellales bacterium]
MQDPRSIPDRHAARLAAAGGSYVDDLDERGCLHAAIVRAAVPHARLGAIDATRALALPGVVGVFDQAALDAMGAGRIRVGWVVSGQRGAENDILARDRLRYVGEPVAVVLARDRYVAEDAVDLVVVEREPLAAVTGVEEALADGAPLLHPAWGDNVLARHHVGEGDPAGRFAEASHVVGERFVLGRAAAMPMETRGALVHVHRLTGQLDVHASVQSPHHVRGQLAEALGCAESHVRVVAPDVGGSFGAKDHLAPEIAAIALLARETGCDVKWIEDRHEHLVACPHSREQLCDVEVAADDDGRILALRGRILFDAGAYSGAHGIGTAIYSASIMPGPYAISDYELDVIGVVTNKAPSAAYRGYGGPEATFVREGLVDRLARRLGLDPAEVRRRNLISRSAFPYRNAAGLVYDEADHGQVLERALQLAGYEARPSRADDGNAVGLGIACVVQPGGFGPSRAAADAGMLYGGFETATVRMDATGHAVLLTGMSSQGQGIDTALAQVCAAELGLDPEHDVTVIAGDTAATPYSPVGAIASRGAAVGGGAVKRAAAELAARLAQTAALLLEAAPGDIVLGGRRARVRGSGHVGIPIATVASALQRGAVVPDGVAPGLEVTATYDPVGETTSYGTHVARVRVDRETGEVALERYVCVHDCGHLINPGIVRGQIVGAVVQGIGGALFEEVRYGADGSFLSGSLNEYRLPTTADVPRIDAEFLELPTTATPTGSRGAGEIGIDGPAAAIANAIGDALGSTRCHPSRTPMTPRRIWQLEA